MCGMPGGRTGLDLCGYCRASLPLDHPSSDVALTGFSRVVVPFRYEYPVDRFVRALKFGGQREYARILGTLLAAEVLSREGPIPQTLVPVPLHVMRYRSRGFNQSSEIARFAAARLGVRVDARCLVRVIPTVEQSALPLRERRRNVRGAF
jgi:predicted amidophosphoribosyltransferase